MSPGESRRLHPNSRFFDEADRWNPSLHPSKHLTHVNEAKKIRAGVVATRPTLLGLCSFLTIHPKIRVEDTARNRALR
jgi:hypothetical protein